MDQKVETLIWEECYSDHARCGQAEDRIDGTLAGLGRRATEFVGMAGRFLGAQMW
jgi:hypothetical protein